MKSTDKAQRNPAETRSAIRQGEWNHSTVGCCSGFTQVNIVIVPFRYAFDFLLFCQRNPKPCPLLEVMEPGVYEPRLLAPGADIRTDCPRYRVFRGATVQECTDIRDIWRDDLVTFLLGCSFTFEWALLQANIPVRNIEEDKIVPVFVTKRPCLAAGPFGGRLVVSMRPIPAHLVSRAVQVTARYPGVHGAPVHIGDPEGLGITDLQRPDYGDAVAIRSGEVPVFWACGVTPQVALLEIEPELAVTHAPGYMFITDRREEDFSE
jgi:uncharacterized protein YcsI (UPF0317 family)